MIKEILSPETCAECKGCCYFDKDDMWEIPHILPETAEYIRGKYDFIELLKLDNVYTFKVPDDFNENETYVCPLLSETGCVLGEKKPFDCAIYPFRIMKDNDGIARVAISNYCNGISKTPINEIKDFLYSTGLYKRIMDYMNINPATVLDYTNEYRIIC